MSQSIDSKINDAFEITKKEIKEIEQAQEKILDTKWQTSCRLMINNKKYCIQALQTRDEILEVTSFVLNYFKDRELALSFLDNPEFFSEETTLIGYTKDEWLSDIKRSFTSFMIKERKNKLSKRYEQLKEILSAEQLRELRFKEIMEL